MGLTVYVNVVASFLINGSSVHRNQSSAPEWIHRRRKHSSAPEHPPKTRKQQKEQRQSGSCHRQTLSRNGCFGYDPRVVWNIALHDDPPSKRKGSASAAKKHGFNESQNRFKQSQNSLDRFWPPLGHPWSDFINFLLDSRSNFAPNFKDSDATNYLHHTFKKSGKD